MGSNHQRRVSTEASSLSCIVTRASFVMAGEQSVNVGSHHARTEQARLLLTWPTVMVTFTSVEQVEVVVEAFTDATGAARRLPERAAPSMFTGLAEFSTFVPAVSIVLVDTPTTVVRLGQAEPGAGGWAHRARWVDITIAGCLWRLLDQEAHASTMKSVAALLPLARATFGQ